jgi:hypothetical protein
MLVRSWRSSSPWLHGLSPEEQASIDGRLIHDHRGLIEEPPTGGFLLAGFERPTSVHGTNRTNRAGLMTSVVRDRPEVTFRSYQGRFWTHIGRRLG